MNSPAMRSARCSRGAGRRRAGRRDRSRVGGRDVRVRGRALHRCGPSRARYADSRVARGGACCSTSRASTCIAHGRQRRTRCSVCATTPRPPTRNTRACTMSPSPAYRSRLTFDPGDDIAAPYVATGVAPKVAILREQGVNGHVEMAAAFDRAGFAAFDVHMTDIIGARTRLDELRRHRRRRRLLLRRRARRGRGLGEVDPVQSARARRIRGVFRAHATPSRSACAMDAR